MNQNAVSFRSQFILESLVKKDPDFIFNLAHDSKNKVTDIVLMTSYMRDNFERLGNYISIYVIHSSICVIKNHIGKINVVCEGFVFVGNSWCLYIFYYSLFNMGPLREKNQVYAIFSDEFMTNSILDSIGMNDTIIFYDHFNLKMNLKKALLSKWIVFKTLHRFNIY